MNSEIIYCVLYLFTEKVERKERIISFLGLRKIMGISALFVWLFINTYKYEIFISLYRVTNEKLDKLIIYNFKMI